jgi:hypothetical protein
VGRLPDLLLQLFRNVFFSAALGVGAGPGVCGGEGCSEDEDDSCTCVEPFLENFILGKNDEDDVPVLNGGFLIVSGEAGVRLTLGTDEAGVVAIGVGDSVVGGVSKSSPLEDVASGVDISSLSSSSSSESSSEDDDIPPSSSKSNAPFLFERTVPTPSV